MQRAVAVLASAAARDVVDDIKAAEVFDRFREKQGNLRFGSDITCVKQDVRLKIAASKAGGGEARAFFEEASRRRQADAAGAADDEAALVVQAIGHNFPRHRLALVWPRER